MLLRAAMSKILFKCFNWKKSNQFNSLFLGQLSLLFWFLSELLNVLYHFVTYWVFLPPVQNVQILLHFHTNCSFFGSEGRTIQLSKWLCVAVHGTKEHFRVMPSNLLSTVWCQRVVRIPKIYRVRSTHICAFHMSMTRSPSPVQLKHVLYLTQLLNRHIKRLVSTTHNQQLATLFAAIDNKLIFGKSFWTGESTIV